jgi:DNA recombination-dependent growth factor C
MGLYSGSVSYVRYTAEDDVPENIKDHVLKKLKEFSFREIDAGSQNEKSSGWVSAENMASTFFDDLHFAKEPYLAFSLRIDVRRIPGLTMKAAFLREEIKYKKSMGIEVLKKKDKDMIKEHIRQDLTKRALPTPAVFDVCWNIAAGTVLFFSTSKSANDEFVSFFYRVFGIKLTRLAPYDLAGFLFKKKDKILDIQDLTVSFTDG